MAYDNQNESKSSDPGVDESLARHGGLSYLEIPAVDVRLSAVFYEQVLGWNVQWREADDYRFSDATGHLIGRWKTDRMISQDPGLLPYMYVDDINKAVERVAIHGGEINRPPYPEGNLWVATVRDPAGNVIGLWQQGRRKADPA
jgi:uncharacterized protein